MGNVVSASALVRHCGLQRKLNRERKRTPDQQRAMDLGTLFHSLVKGVTMEDAEVFARAHGLDDFDLRTAVEWDNYMRATWRRPAGLEHEVALGLSTKGVHVPVVEVRPHVYEPDPARPAHAAVHELLTAGRADLVWSEGDVCHVADLKTGRHHVGDPGTRLQNLVLGFAAADRAGLPAMRLGVYYARDGVWEWSSVIELDGREAARLFDEVVDSARLDETPRPGLWCGSCWERRGCAYAFSGDADAGAA